MRPGILVKKRSQRAVNGLSASFIPLVQEAHRNGTGDRCLVLKCGKGGHLRACKPSVIPRAITMCQKCALSTRWMAEDILTRQIHHASFQPMYFSSFQFFSRS
jgi:hypothetical protein